MPLYRACYLKHGKIKGQTFAASDAAAATRYAHTVLESLFGVPMLTVKQIPSKINPTSNEPIWFTTYDKVNNV